MRRAIVALVVTAVAVVLVARYDTHPPRTVNPQADDRRPLRRHRRGEVPGPAGAPTARR